MTLAFGGITTVVTTGLPAIGGVGGGTRTLTTKTIEITGAAEQPTLYEQVKEWLPPYDAPLLTIAPNPNDSYPTISSGIVPTAYKTQIIDFFYATSAPTTTEFVPGYWNWDMGSLAQEQFVLESPNITGSAAGYGRMGNPILLDFGGDLTGIPAWALWQPARRMWVRDTGKGILYSGTPPTDPRAVPFPWHNPPVAPTWPPARGPTTSVPYFQGRGGMIQPDTGKFYLLPLVGNDSNPILSATWWGLPPLYAQIWGKFYIGGPKTFTATLRMATKYGVVSTLDTQTITMGFDGDADPYSMEGLYHLDTVITSTATIPADCEYVWWIYTGPSGLNDGAPFNWNVWTPATPSHHRGLVQCPETGCPLDLGYMLQVN